MGTTVYLTTTAQFHLESSYPFQVDSITVQRVSDVQGPRRVWAPIHGGGGIPRKAPWSSPRRCRPWRRSCGPIILTSVGGSFCNWHQSRTARPAMCVVSERPRPPPTESKIDLYHPSPGSSAPPVWLWHPSMSCSPVARGYASTFRIRPPCTVPGGNWLRGTWRL